MAEDYGFTPQLEGLFSTLRRKRLGGQSYDPRIVKDFAEGAYEAAIAKNIARRKLAEDKEYRDKVLADTQAGRAETLAQQAKQFDTTTKNTEAWRALQAEETEEARKDAEMGNMINSLLKGASMIPSYFMNKENGGTAPIGRSTLSKAGDLFKKSLGGAVPGTETGGTTGGFVNDATPDNWDLMGMPASAPVTETAAPAIGTKTPGTWDVASYNEAMTGSKPTGQTEMIKGPGGPSESFNNQTSMTGQGSVPAIGAPVDSRSATGMAKGYEDTDVTKDAAAAEPHTSFGAATETGTGAEGAADINIPAYEAPPAFQEFTPDAYVPPTFDPYKQKTYAELGGDEAYHTAGGKYSDSQSDKNLWATSRNQQESKKYDTWVNSQKAASQAAYNNWLTEEKGRYDTAKEAYEADVARGKSAYDKKVSALKNVGHSDEHVSRSPWSFNEKRALGGRPTEVQEYYGHQFTPDFSITDARKVHEYDMAGLYNPGGATKEYYSGKAPTFSSESQGRASFDVGEFKSGGGWESPYNYSQMDWGAGAAEYNSPSPSYDYSPSYEAFNYEPPPSYGGDYSYEDSSYSGGGFDSGDGKIVCTELNRQGYLPDETLAKDSECREKHIPFNVYTGYLTLFGPVVALMRRSKVFTNIVRPFGVATAREMASRVDPNIRGNWLGKTILKIGVPLCGAVGNVVLAALKTAVQKTEVQHG